MQAVSRNLAVVDTPTKERFFVCPYCWQRVPALLDIEPGNHHTVTDCGVCCNMVDIHYAVDNKGTVVAMEVIKPE